RTELRRKSPTSISVHRHYNRAASRGTASPTLAHRPGARRLDERGTAVQGGFVKEENVVPAEPVREWVFELTNLQFGIGDEKTELPLPEGAPVELQPGWLRNRIPIEFEGRRWDIIDRTIGQPPLSRTGTDGNALLTGELRTRC